MLFVRRIAANKQTPLLSLSRLLTSKPRRWWLVALAAGHLPSLLLSVNFTASTSVELDSSSLPCSSLWISVSLTDNLAEALSV